MKLRCPVCGRRMRDEDARGEDMYECPKCKNVACIEGDNVSWDYNSPEEYYEQCDEGECVDWCGNPCYPDCLTWCPMGDDDD